MVDFTYVRGLLSGKSSAEVARITALLVAPLTVLLLSVAGENAPGFAVDLTSPVTLATLRTQLSADGTIAPREGLAIVVEPEPVDYHIPIEHSQGLWLSLDAESVRANRQHLVVDDSGITCRAPLLGVQE